MSKVNFGGNFDLSVLSDGTLQLISSSVGRFHIISASYGLSIATGSSSGVLATFDVGVFGILTGTNTLATTLTGSSESFTTGHIQTLDGLALNYTNITGTYYTGNVLLFTSGSIQSLAVLSASINTASFQQLSSTIGRFHILSASFANISVGTGSSSGSLATYNVGVFDVLTGTLFTGSNLLIVSSEMQYLTVHGGLVPAFIDTGIDLNNSNITNAGTITGSTAQLTIGTIQKLTASVGITGSDSKFTTGHIQTLDGLAISYTNITGSFFTGSSLLLTSAEIQKITASVGITGSGLFFTNGTIQTLNGLSANFTFITGTNVILTSLTGTSLTGTTLLYTNGTIQNLNTLSGTINTGSFNEISSTIGRFHISSASFLLALNITGTTLNYTNGNIQTLVSLFGNFTNLTGTNLTGSSLLFTNGTIQTLNTLNGVFTILTATNGLITTLTGTTVNYTTGHIQTLDGLSVNYTNMTGTNQTGSSILLTTAEIQKITASVGITGSGLLFTNGTVQSLTASVVFSSSLGNFTELSASSYNLQKIVQIIASDPNGSAITTGDGKAYFMVPSEFSGCNLISANMGFITGSSSGIPTVQIRNVTAAVDMLSTKITVDVADNPPTSYTAATPSVVDTSNDDVQTGEILAIDIDVAGTGAKGLMVTLVFNKP